MEEIWNYNVSARDGKVHLAVWGSGILEFDVKTENWKVYLDPDGEMEIDLYRDDGNVHVITTGASYIDKVLWISSYFGCARYDGRHWRGYLVHDCGLPSNFNNNLSARSAWEAWFCTQAPDSCNALRVGHRYVNVSEAPLEGVGRASVRVQLRLV